MLLLMKMAANGKEKDMLSFSAYIEKLESNGFSVLEVKPYVNQKQKAVVRLSTKDECKKVINMKQILKVIASMREAIISKRLEK